jgi:hypothetical protein
MKTTPHDETGKISTPKKYPDQTIFLELRSIKYRIIIFECAVGFPPFLFFPALFSLYREFSGNLPYRKPSDNAFSKPGFPSLPQRKILFGIRSGSKALPRVSLFRDISGVVLIFSFSTSERCFFVSGNSDFPRTYAPFASFSGAHRKSLSHEILIPF